MQVDQTTHKCAHEACSCEVHVSQKYCGPQCQAAARDHQSTHDMGQCGCGHATCSAADNYDQAA